MDCLSFFSKTYESLPCEEQLEERYNLNFNPKSIRIINCIPLIGIPNLNFSIILFLMYNFTRK